MPRQIFTCAYCHRPFESHPAFKRQFCSKTCAYAAKTIPPAVRFWRYVDRSGGPRACWPWTGYCDAHGYGDFTIAKGSRISSHRFAYELTYGLLLSGFYACHTCDNPPCCNPAHLFPGTTWDNTHDAITKGRYAHGARVNTCKLTPAQVLEIRALQTYWGGGKIARQYGVTSGTIHAIWRRKNWKHL